MNGKKARMTLFFSAKYNEQALLLLPQFGRGTQKLMPHMPGYARSNAAY